MNLFTIGYEGLNTDDFMALLFEHGIETVVDVRALPLSRKPGFSKSQSAMATAPMATGSAIQRDSSNI